MRFNCGHWPDKKKRLKNWHRWFAWFPVKVAPYDCRWLERVERKGVHHVYRYSSRWTWEFRPAK